MIVRRGNTTRCCILYLRGHSHGVLVKTRDRDYDARTFTRVTGCVREGGRQREREKERREVSASSTRERRKKKKKPLVEATHQIRRQWRENSWGSTAILTLAPTIQIHVPRKPSVHVVRRDATRLTRLPDFSDACDRLPEVSCTRRETRSVVTPILLPHDSVVPRRQLFVTNVIPNERICHDAVRRPRPLAPTFNSEWPAVTAKDLRVLPLNPLTLCVEDKDHNPAPAHTQRRDSYFVSLPGNTNES